MRHSFLLLFMTWFLCVYASLGGKRIPVSSLVSPSPTQGIPYLSHFAFRFVAEGTYIMTTALLPLLEKAADARVITVSSGGMLVQKLNVSDLQSGNGPFDGTMVYAQNKRQQVVLTEQWAKAHRNIHFSVMHPGWADTPAVRSSMPDFYERMRNSLRTEAQGADTVLWLAVSAEATKLPSGLFFQDRQPVPTHLPLAYTHSPPEDEEKLMQMLEEFSQKFKSVSPGT